MSTYLLAHDLGTSGNKAVLYNEDGVLLASALETYPTYYPADGYVEQSAEDWWRAVCLSTHTLMKKADISPKDIAAVSFSGQMMGCLMLDENGTPLRNSIIWADTRAKAQEAWMIDKIGMDRGYKMTGHRISSSYSVAKLLWLRDNEPDLYKKCAKLLNAKDYMVYKLTGEFATDYSDGGGTNLMDIQKRQWSKDLLEAFDIPANLLPTLCPSTAIVGGVTKEAAELTGLLAGTPVVLGGGDGSCATVGAGAVALGSAYTVLGSSAWISVVTKEPLFDEAMRTFNWVHLDGKLYTPCGTAQAAGYAYNWYKNTFGGESYAEMNREAKKTPPGAGGVLFLPYLLGERTPWWNSDARGAFIGMNISTTKAEMTRALLEGVGMNLRAILEILEAQSPIEKLTLIGGGAKGREWLQMLADIWQKPITVPRYLEEATGMGAAICAGVGTKLFPDFSVAQRWNETSLEILPQQNLKACYDRLYDIFLSAYTAMVPVYGRLADFKRHQTDQSPAALRR